VEAIEGAALVLTSGRADEGVSGRSPSYLTWRSNPHVRPRHGLSRGCSPGTPPRTKKFLPRRQGRRSILHETGLAKVLAPVTDLLRD